MKIGEKIRELRKKYKFGVQEFADKIGISRSFLNFIETGKRNPSTPTLKKICDVFQISLAELYEDIDLKEPKEKQTIGEELNDFLKINGIDPSELSVENQKRIAEKFADLYILYAKID